MTDAVKACDVQVQPRITQAPLRFIRSKVTIEDRSGGRLVLVDADDEWTSGTIQAGPRTTWVEWKNVVLGPGEYAVVLLTRGCTARDTLQVVD